jgi:RNA polymerase sigma-70 factor (ECF subfamily)
VVRLPLQFTWRYSQEMSTDSPTPEPCGLDRRNLSSATDMDLLQAMQQGQTEALGMLYDRYARLVYGLALRILENPQEAEDLTQDIFLSLYHRNTYDPKRGALSSFLTTLTRSRAIDKLRSRGTRFRFLERWKGVIRDETTSVSPMEQVSTLERSQQVREALAQLPETERQVLEVAYYEGLSQSEIAKRLNIPLGTAKTRSRQGLLKLRRLLQDTL